MPPAGWAILSSCSCKLLRHVHPVLLLLLQPVGEQGVAAPCFSFAFYASCIHVVHIRLLLYPVHIPYSTSLKLYVFQTDAKTRFMLLAVTSPT